MAVHALFGLALTLGYRTSAITVVCWYLTRSLQLRNNMVLNGGDVVLGAVLFWAMFLPWGARWSLDSLSRGPSETGSRISSIASLIFTLQLPFIYWLSLMHKLEPTWLSGQAVYYALNSHLYARQSAQLLLAVPSLPIVLTCATMVWEGLGPFLLLSPRTGVRLAASAAFALMHLAFGVFLQIGIFAVAPLLFLVALAPGELWDRATRRLKSVPAPLLRLARRLPPPPDYRLPPELRPVLIFLAVYSLLQGVGQDSRLEPMVPTSLGWVEEWTGLQQRWTVFLNLPGLDDGWIVIEGQQTDGTTVDIFQGNQPVDWQAPMRHSKIHGLYRWPNAMVVVLSNPSLHQPFLATLVKDWNERSPDQPLLEARFYFVHCPMQPGNQDRVPRRQLLSVWKSEG